MKKIMSITIAVALILAQSAIAEAFVIDKQYGNDYSPGDSQYAGPPFTASVDLSTGTPVATLTVAIKKVSDNSSATVIGWSGVNLGVGWKKSDHYLHVTYDANKVGWGVQIYTDNMDASADPKYSGDPTTYLNRQPAGLIGADNKLLTCPLALLVTDAVVSSPDTNIAVPHEVEFGTPGTDNHGYYFDTGVDEVAGGAHEKVWFWLKDKSGTKWDDADDDNIIDPGELVASFSSTGDDYATIIQSLGSSSGWMDSTGTFMLRDSSSTSPIIAYLAAKFINAKELQEYKTNTLALELYHQ